MTSKYTTIYRDRLTGKLVSKRKWKANPKARTGLGKRYVKQRIHKREEGQFRYILRKQTPKGQFRGQKWQESKVEVTITSDHKLDANQIAAIADALASQQNLPSGITVDLVEWTTGRRTKSYSSERDAQTGFDRFQQFFSEEIK